MSTQELFPRHLLVSVDANRQVYTTSRRVAEHFGRLHQNVLRSIEQIVTDLQNDQNGQLKIELANPTSGRDFPPAEQFIQRNFQPTAYLDEQGKFRPEYHLTHDGFALLAMGFTGREAMQWKVSFLEAFRALERQLRELTNQESQALRSLHPRWPIIRDGTLQGLSRQQLCALTGHKHPSSITANRRRLRELGLLPETITH